MTDPSQYFRGRTVQEQMNEVIGYVDVRSAEVATDAIASDVAQVHSDAADAHTDALAAAASAAAAAGTLTNAVKKTGEASQSIAGDIAVAGDLSGGTVTVPTPVNNTDAASKKYVDDADALKISISDINQYAVGLTGNQTPIAGNKFFQNNAATTSASAAPKGSIELTNIDMGATFPGNRYLYTNTVVDQNGAIVGSIRIAAVSSSQTLIFSLATTKSDGTSITLKELARYDRVNDVWS